MEFFRIRRDIPFMRHALVFNAISFIPSGSRSLFLLTRGLHLSVEFTGGTVMEVSYAQAADLEQIRAAVDQLDRRRVAGAELRHLARRADPPAAASRAGTSGAAGAETRDAER